jgi:hypothetical protein
MKRSLAQEAKQEAFRKKGWYKLKKLTQHRLPAYWRLPVRKAIFPILFMLFSISTVHAYSENEITAITKTALNYMVGWYQGDAKRMKASLHKKLANRSFQAVYGNNKELRLTSASDMIAYTQHRY